MRAASAVTDVTLDQHSDATCTLADRAHVASTFIFCLACLVSYRPLAKLRPIPANLFAPGLCARAGTSPRAFPVSLRLRCLCFAWRLPSRRQVFRRFHNVNASTDCSTTAFDHNRVQPRLAQPTPWVSNPSRYPAVTRDAALSRSARPLSSVRGGGAALFAAAPAILCFAAAHSAAPAIVSREGSILQRRRAHRTSARVALQ